MGLKRNLRRTRKKIMALLEQNVEKARFRIITQMGWDDPKRSALALEILSLLPEDLTEGVDPRLWRGFPPPSREPVVVDMEAERIIVLHLHYRDLWMELASVLQGMPRPWGLIVTVTSPSAIEMIKSAFPGALVLLVGNRGRDMGPFFEILHAGLIDKAKYICKIHGKKSLDHGIRRAGELWRRSAFLSLLGSKERIESICAQLDGAGVIGPAHLRFPNDRFAESACWDEHRNKLNALALRLGIIDPKPDFFGGSMFWVSAPVIKALKTLELRQSDFESEAEYSQTSLAHACERIIIPAAQSIGLPGKSISLFCSRNSVERQVDPMYGTFPSVDRSKADHGMPSTRALSDRELEEYRSIHCFEFLKRQETVRNS